ncbi:MAG: hypothetical protein QXK18_03905 [Candidatus Bathyarchaeia archaeon]
MEKWQITAILGTIIFLIAGALPLVAGVSLFDAYGAVLSGAGAGGIPISTASVGILLTIILYPITVILGFVSIIKRKLAIIAGILGIICWIGAILFINEISGGVLGYGYGIYVGFIGAIILLVTYFIKPKAAT